MKQKVKVFETKTIWDLTVVLIFLFRLLPHQSKIICSAQLRLCLKLLKDQNRLIFENCHGRS